MRHSGFPILLAWLAITASGLAAGRPTRTLADLAAGAEVIFIGRCEAVSCHWNDAHSLILTASRFRVERSLKGAPGAAFTLDELGGMVGSRGMSASGTPRFAVGDELLLCAHRSLLGRWETCGGEAGKFRVFRDPSGQPRVSSGFYRAELAAMTPGGMRAGGAPLAVFAGHLLAAAKTRRVR